MSFTERLANLSIPTVLVTMAVLLVLRYVLLKQRTPVAKSIAEIAESLAVALGLVFLLIRPFIIQAFFIPSASMHPTLLERDHILVNKFIYRFREPKLGDVVVFKSPPEANPDGVERDFIKRVIAVPGDTVRITPGYVLVGNEQLGHDQLRSLLADPMIDDPVRLQRDKVLVDGREVSEREIAALAGHPEAKVKVVPGQVFINGRAIDEPYIAEDADRPYPMATTPDKWIVVDRTGEREVKVPAGKLLVMGDNRNDSNDARFWGLLDRDRLQGKAMFIFWPVSRVHWIR